MKQKKSLYNDKSVNPSGSQNYKYVYTKHWSTLIYKANTTEIKGDKQQYNSWER